ncbi:hypothetical protein [Endozoicomonas sp. 8E]|uniref:hypothetical protein n=1 Tax=Endozoicomonas sp. 8E TaxID=3035692 RepID=UPI002938E5CB|nr:hypothetical protein [Endozoicomonas sp. 8E]WOG29007.1 hypothetical protein P6910_04910 [Endozoicomonas sp. 8E]
MLLALLVVCQTEALTRLYIIELGQDAASPKQNSTIKREPPALSCNPSDIADTNGYAGPALPPHEKRHRSDSYGLKMTFVESIPWQLLYAAHLQVVYELILPSSPPARGATFYPQLPVEAILFVSWLLKSYLNTNSKSFNLVQQQASQDYPFTAITGMIGSGHEQTQYSPSASSGQQVSVATIPLAGYVTDVSHSDSGNGNGDPEQPPHTLGLNCFVLPCNGVCQFRPSSDNREPAEWSQCSELHSTGQTGATYRQSSCPHLANRCCHSCLSYFDLVDAKHSQESVLYQTLDDAPDIQDLLNSDVVFGSQAHEFDCNPIDGDASSSMNTGKALRAGDSGLFNDDLTMPGDWFYIANDLTANNELPGRESLLVDDPIFFTPADSERQQIITEPSRSGQGQPLLSRTGITEAADQGEKKPNLAVLAEGRQPQPLRTVCKNARGLSNRRSRLHIEQRICDVIVIGEDGQQRPCGKICKNARVLSSHKSGRHSGQKTCDLTVLGEDGQQRSCGKVFKNLHALYVHKNNFHIRHRTCVVAVVREDGQRRICGVNCKTARDLTAHKQKEHSGQQACDLTLAGLNQQHPCKVVSKNAKALTVHKRMHRKRKPVDLDQDNDNRSREVK